MALDGLFRERGHACRDLAVDRHVGDPDFLDRGDQRPGLAGVPIEKTLSLQGRDVLHHLLSLENCAPAANQSVPQELEGLFLDLGTFKQRADLLLGKIQAASNALSRSLLKPEMIALQNELTMWREKLRGLVDSATDHLREINPQWLSDRATQIAALTRLYLKFAYLGRWSEQLDEIAFQLSL